MADLDLRNRAETYVARHKLEIFDFLGDGTDGSVWATNRTTAIKVMQRQRNYDMELACYQRLWEHKVIKIMQFAIPRLIGSDDELLVIEMSIVSPPYLIDFGKAYVDFEPEFSPETSADEIEKQHSVWQDRFEVVQAALGFLRHNYGIFYHDPNANNIVFGDQV